MFWIILFPEICNLTLEKNINFFLRKVWVVSVCRREVFHFLASGLIALSLLFPIEVSMVYPKFWRLRMNWKKKYLISESLASSVTYLYLKNFKALCFILNHFIEAHISDKAFSPRFLSKVNKMKRKVTYSYKERNQSRIRESLIWEQLPRLT